MNVILGATEEMQEAPKEHRRGEFLKGFSSLMGIYISTCLSAFAWFDPDTPLVASLPTVSAAAAGPAPG